MRKIITALLLIISVNLFGQNPNNGEKKDTVVVPIYEKYDTIPATILYGLNNMVVYVRGFAVLKGFAVQGKDKKWRWTEQPKVSAALDDKKRPITKDIIQIL